MTSNSEPPGQSYVPLWCKSNYSFLEGASTPEELVATAGRLELPALGLTDRDGLYGVVRAHLEAKKLGVKLIIGSQITVKQADPGTILLLAQNRIRYSNLCRIISTGRLRSPKGSCLVNWEEICEHSAGLIALWDGKAPPDSEQGPDKAAADLFDAFPDRLFLLLPRHRRAEEASAEARLLQAASRFGLPLVAATEVLYHDLSRKYLQDVLTCIRNNCTPEPCTNSSSRRIPEFSGGAWKSPDVAAFLWTRSSTATLRRIFPTVKPRDSGCGS
jgi:error-prone DNA polymerase